MSEENYQSSKVLPWSGQQEDWPMWSTKFMIRGTAKGYGLIMKGVVKAPAFDEDIENMVNPDDPMKSATAEQKKAAKQLRQLNIEGYMDLIMSMNDTRSFNLVKEKEQDLYGAWKALSNEFEPNTGDALVELMEEYNSFKLENVKVNVSDFISEMELKRQRIKLLGQDITDKMFMIQILASLPKEYVLLTTQLKREVARDSISLPELREELKGAYNALKKANGWSDEEIALSAKTKIGKYNFRKKFKGLCRLCGKQGHKASECWERKERYENSEKIESYKNN